jgi:hypothetical protein
MVGMKRLTIFFLLICLSASAQTFPSWVSIRDKPFTDLREARITAGTDITARFAACIASGNRNIYIPEGTYCLTLGISLGISCIGRHTDTLRQRHTTGRPPELQPLGLGRSG